MTQAALAVVGTFIGSSLLSIAVFYLILRCRNKRRDGKKVGSVRRQISAPTQFRKTESGLGAAYGSTDNLMRQQNSATGPEYSANSYPRDIKQPMPPAATTSNSSTNVATQYVDAAGKYPANRSSSVYDTPTTAVNKPPAAARFSIFPKSSAGSPGPGSPGVPGDRRSRNVSRPPSLQQWLRAGAVSPFAAAPKSELAAKSSAEAAAAAQPLGGDAWPLSGNSIKRPAVGRLPKPVGGGGPMMQPRTKLPFRED